MPLSLSNIHRSMILARHLPIALPAIHAALFLLTIISGEKTASGGNPFFCVDLPLSLPLVARDDAATFAAVAVLGTAWWFFVGQIGSSSSRGKLSRTGSGLGALLILSVCAAGFFALISEFLLISREVNFSAVNVAIYVLAVALLLGGLISAGFSVTAGLGLTRD